jgi:hypothetical protein
MKCYLLLNIERQRPVYLMESRFFVRDRDVTIGCMNKDSVSVKMSVSVSPCGGRRGTPQIIVSFQERKELGTVIMFCRSLLELLLCCL